MKTLARIAVTLALIFAGAVSVGCGGRASLAEDSGRVTRQVWSAQANARPRRPLPPWSARDIHAAMNNHNKLYDSGPSGGMGAGAPTGGGAAGSGAVNPMSSDMGGIGEDEFNQSGIRLQAK